MNRAGVQGLINALPIAERLFTALGPIAPGSYQRTFEKGLVNALPMLANDPQNVTMQDLLNSGLGVMPLSMKGYKTVAQGMKEISMPLKRSKSGQYIGAPKGIDSPEKVQELIDAYKLRVKKALDWVSPGYFYKEGGETLKKIAKDPEEARRLSRIIAATSKQSTPQENIAFAIKGMNQGAAGLPIQTGLYPDPELLTGLYKGNDIYTGYKTNAFGEGFFEYGNPNAAAPNDRWEFRGMGFKKEAGDARNHAFINNVRKEALRQFNSEYNTNLTPLELQELHWAEMRKENGIPLKPGDTLENAFKNNIIQHGRESMPGSTSGHLTGMKPEDLQPYHEKLKGIFVDPVTGKDRLIDAMGGLQFPVLDSPGVYGGKVTPGWQGRSLGYRTLSGIDPTDIARIKATESIYGLMAGQDMGGATMMNGLSSLAKINPESATGYIVKNAHPMTAEEAKGLISVLQDKMQHNDFFPIAMEEGGGVINYGSGNLTDAINNVDMKKIFGEDVVLKPTSPASIGIKLPWSRGKATAKMLSTLKSESAPNLRQMADAPEVRNIAGKLVDLYSRMKDKIPNEKLVSVLSAWHNGGIPAVEDMVRRGLAPAIALSIISENYDSQD